MTIDVLYTCSDCGLVKAACSVPARVDEDVRDWMDNTLIHVASDHRRRSPRCKADRVDLMIPVTGADRIGGPSLH